MTFLPLPKFFKIQDYYDCTIIFSLQIKQDYFGPQCVSVIEVPYAD